MPNTSSYADIVRDWDLLLTSSQDVLENLPEAERYRSALQQILEETRAIKARQESARAIRQQATQELKAKLQQGRDLAISLRGAVRSGLGPRNERLVQFRVAPLRKRGGGEKPGEPGPSQPTSPPAVTPPPAPKLGDFSIN
jgi:hypothetical protein